MSRGQSVVLAMRAADALLGGSDIGLLVRLREPLDADALFDAYARMLAARPEMRMELVLEGGRFAWRAASERDWQTRLEHERERWQTPSSAAELASEHRPLPSSLPLLVRRTPEGALYVAIQHAWADGMAALHWLDLLLGYYAGDDTTSVTRALAPMSAPAPALALLRMLLRLSGAAPWARLHARDIADLSLGAAPSLPNRAGFAAHDAVLEAGTLERLQHRALARRATLTQLLCVDVARTLFELSPARRVRLSVPVALSDQPRTLYQGNRVASLPVELVRGGDLLAQAQAAFRGQASFADGFARLLDGVVARTRDQLALSREMTRHFALPHRHPSRGWLRQYSAIVSNLGRVSGRRLRRQATSVSVHGKFEFLAFGFAQLEGSASMTVIAPRNAFDPARVAALFEQLRTRLQTTSE